MLRLKTKTPEPMSEAEFRERVTRMLLPTSGDSQPNIESTLYAALRELEAMKLNIKHFGYELLQRATLALPVRAGLNPQTVNLGWKACTQADIEAEWVAYWASELKVPVLYNRKLWEFAYILQSVYDAGLLGEGSRGLGFGCGVEPHPCYFASKGVSVTATDLPPSEQAAQAWAATGQHAAGHEAGYQAQFLDRATYDRLVDFRFVDMNHIPETLRDYDFCWSMCALEHLGSIASGCEFIVNSLDTLRPGGLAVHTTEFNFLHDDYTVDNWPTVLFQRRNFTDLADRLRQHGHEVSTLSFDVGTGPIDKFIDIPPFGHNMPEPQRSMYGWFYGPHLKVTCDGIPSTCYGVVVRKKS